MYKRTNIQAHYFAVVRIHKVDRTRTVQCQPLPSTSGKVLHHDPPISKDFQDHGGHFRPRSLGTGADAAAIPAKGQALQGLNQFLQALPHLGFYPTSQLKPEAGTVD